MRYRFFDRLPKSYLHTIQLPFSGSPNSKRMRVSFLGLVPARQRVRHFTAIRGVQSRNKKRRTIAPTQKEHAKKVVEKTYRHARHRRLAESLNLLVRRHHHRMHGFAARFVDNDRFQARVRCL
jgi:hypothetical protein